MFKYQGALKPGHKFLFKYKRGGGDTLLQLLLKPLLKSQSSLCGMCIFSLTLLPSDLLYAHGDSGYSTLNLLARDLTRRAAKSPEATLCC